jgi:hypothetical protein
VRGHDQSPPIVTVIVKISDSAPMHRSHTMAFGANVPNRLQRGHFWPFRRLRAPYRGLAEPPLLSAILITVHSQPEWAAQKR